VSSDQTDELKADLLAILDSGPTAVSADEAIERAGYSGAPDAEARRGWWTASSSRRTRLVTAISFAVVIGLLVGLLATGTSSVSNKKIAALHSGHGGTAHQTALDLAVAAIPSSVYAKVGLPSEIVNYPKRVSGHQRLTAGGLPEMLYVWATYCPFCATENWALASALSRFGTFRGLTVTHSSVTDFAPDTETLDFTGASYSSPYLVFKPYDLATNQQSKRSSSCNVNGYTCLQTAPPSVSGLFESIGGGSLPFMDFGNKATEAGAGFENEPLALAGLTASQIAAQLSDSGSVVAKAEVGSANYLTAAICALTGNEPADVCQTPVVEQAESKEGVGKPIVNAPPPPTTTSPAPTGTTEAAGSRTVLAPATVAPVSNECTIQLSHDADGNVTPLLCDDGGVNVFAWRQYAKGYVCGAASTDCGSSTWAKMMQLGADADSAEVYQAMCSDYKDIYGTKPLTISGEELAAAYYGWNFAGGSPVSKFEQEGCPAS
jgi:Domain of unknown function (DUF929)